MEVQTVAAAVAVVPDLIVHPDRGQLVMVVMVVLVSLL
jgi:hypothetical protein